MNWKEINKPFDNISISSPVSWAFTGLTSVQMFGHFCAYKSVWLTLFVLGSPHLAELVCFFLALYFCLAYLSMVPFASWTRRLSYSVTDLSTCFLLFVQHIPSLFSLLFQIRQWFWSASVSHSFLHQRCVQALFLHHLFEPLHRFVLLNRCSVSFQSVLFSESMLLSLNFMEGLLNFLIDFWSQIILNFHAFHFKQKVFFLLELIKLFPNVRINKICNVFTVVDFRNDIVFPFFRNDVMLLKWNAENTCTALLLFNLSDSFLFLDFSGQVNLDWRPFDVVSLFRLGDVHAVDVILLCLDDFGFGLRQFDVEYQFAGHLSSDINILEF